MDVSRSTIAISEDQNYLCLLITNEWMVFKIDWEEWTDIRMKALIPYDERIMDTGQDAHEVLAAFLTSKEN